MKHRSRALLEQWPVLLLQTLACIFLALPVNAQSSGTASADSSNYLLRKGNRYVGATFSFNRSGTTNESRLGVLIEEQDRNDFAFSLDIGRFLKDNWALGGVMGYNQGKRIGREINSDGVAADVSMIERSIGLYASMKNLIPLDPGTGSSSSARSSLADRAIAC